jgi:hypothetical protein
MSRGDGHWSAKQAGGRGLEDLQKARVLRWISGQTERRMVHFRRRLSRTGGDACCTQHCTAEGGRRFAGSCKSDLLVVYIRRKARWLPLVTRRVKMFSRLGGDGSGLTV